MAKKVEKKVTKQTESKEKKAPKKISAKISDGFTKEQRESAASAYADQLTWQVYANLFALDGARFEILENVKTGEALVFRLPFDEKLSSKGKNPYPRADLWGEDKNAFSALYRLNTTMKNENASAWRLQRKAQEEMKKVAKEMRIEEKEAQRKKEKEARKEAKEALQEAPKAPSKAPKASAKQEEVKAPKASAKGQKEAPKAHKGQRVKV